MSDPIYVKDKGYYLKYYVTKFVYWLGKIFSIQCSGKLKYGHANVWCQYRLGHDGPCIDAQGIVFERSYEFNK